MKSAVLEQGPTWALPGDPKCMGEGPNQLMNIYVYGVPVHYFVQGPCCCSDGSANEPLTMTHLWQFKTV